MKVRQFDNADGLNHASTPTERVEIEALDPHAIPHADSAFLHSQIQMVWILFTVGIALKGWRTRLCVHAISDVSVERRLARRQNARVLSPPIRCERQC